MRKSKQWMIPHKTYNWKREHAEWTIGGKFRFSIKPYNHGTQQKDRLMSTHYQIIIQH
jgi:hypothetical protein